MQIIRDISNINLSNSVITTGNFDGVHIGHRYLLSRLVEKAKELGGQSVVVMFSPHPREVLHGASDIQFLSTDEEKFSLIESCGIDAIVIIPFTKELAAKSAEDFMTKILVDKLGMTFFLVGYNHRIGNPKLGGSIDEIAARHGIAIEHYTPYESPYGKVSSSVIRKEIEVGSMDLATRLLGRYYSIKSSVVEGKKVGRSIGYRTANLQPVSKRMLIPAEGVYAVYVRVEEETYGAMLQVGHRPTLDDGRGLTIEAHLFDFDKDIYGQEVMLEFVTFVRNNKRFDSVAELQAQLVSDERQVRSILG